MFFRIYTRIYIMVLFIYGVLYKIRRHIYDNGNIYIYFMMKEFTFKGGYTI